MPDWYHDGQRALQDRFDTRRLADRLGEVAGDTFGPEFSRFIAARDMFFIATTGPDGAPDCSYKGGDVGFVRVVDEHTVEFPVYDGNGMFRTLGNITVNPAVALLFIDFSTGTRLRVNGDATVVFDGDARAAYPGSIAVVRVTAGAIFPNCGRYVHRYEKAASSPFVPSAEHDPPVPDWKRDPWFDGALPANDPALDPDRPSAPALPRF